jgi:hypothetical protein
MLLLWLDLGGRPARHCGGGSKSESSESSDEDSTSCLCYCCGRPSRFFFECGSVSQWFHPLVVPAPHPAPHPAAHPRRSRGKVLRGANWALFGGVAAPDDLLHFRKPLLISPPRETMRSKALHENAAFFFPQMLMILTPRNLSAFLLTLCMRDAETRADDGDVIEEIKSVPLTVEKYALCSLPALPPLQSIVTFRHGTNSQVSSSKSNVVHFHRPRRCLAFSPNFLLFQKNHV